MEEEVCSEVIASNKKLSQTTLASPNEKKNTTGGGDSCCIGKRCIVQIVYPPENSRLLPEDKHNFHPENSPFSIFQFFQKNGLNSIILESSSILAWIVATRRGFLAPLGNSSATLPPPFLATYLEFRATLNSRDFSPFSRHENTSQPCNCGTFIAGSELLLVNQKAARLDERPPGKDPISSVSLIVSLGRE